MKSKILLGDDLKPSNSDVQKSDEFLTTINPHLTFVIGVVSSAHYILSFDCLKDITSLLYW